MALKCIADCCADNQSNTAHPKKHICPSCGIECAEVSTRAIAHHIRQSWEWKKQAQKYFFCENSHCEVVYFGKNDSSILKAQLRTEVSRKENSDEALLCYCFGVTRADFQNSPQVKDFVLEKPSKSFVHAKPETRQDAVA